MNKEQAMTDTLEVITKNNVAVAAVAQGRQRETTRMMRHTLVKLNGLYQHHLEDKDEVMDMDDDSHDGPSKRKRPTMACSHPIRSVPIERLNCSSDAFPSMFQRALLLSPEEENIPVIAAVVLFNLALSEHLVGASYNNSKKIASAYRFYNLAYQTIEEHKTKCPFEDLLVLAVVNNLGDTCSQLWQTKRSGMWFNCLAHILGMAASSSGKILPSIDEDDYMFFYLNSMMHQGNMLSAAPAA
jgi:hypothetical protein